jgi:sigma-E factor negative regulatory protein RseB
MNPAAEGSTLSVIARKQPTGHRRDVPAPCASARQRPSLAGPLAAAGRSVLLLAALVCAAAVASAGEPVQQGQDESSVEGLLTRMHDAQQRVGYEGTVVYLHANRLATLRVARSIDDGDSKESLLALSGPIRAVARNAHGVTCMLPDALTFATPRGHRSGLLRSVPLDFARIRRHYRLQPLGASRVAGRDTDVIGIVPRDAYRYGYRFFIDRASGLPLKIDLMDDGAEPIEQVMFTQVEIRSVASDHAGSGASAKRPPGIAAAGARPDSEDAAESDSSGDSAASLPRASAAESGWRLTRVPPGFEPLAPSESVSPESVIEHLVVSDGIASVSVYIEAAGTQGLEGAARVGAITALGGRVAGDYHATVVGEVPERTAQMLLEGLEPPRQ